LSRLFEAYRDFYGCSSDATSASRFVKERIEDHSTRFFVALCSAEVVGFVHLLPTYDTLAMTRAWILEDLFVESAHRRAGVATALLQKAEAFAREDGATRITLTTAHTNEAAQAVYVEQGYSLDLVFRTYFKVLT
jgi:GNAT superfamily N-acetyltransferase